MNILLNLILSFYPATLVWYAIPNDYLKKIDSFGTSGTGHFIVRAIIYGLLFVGCYLALNKFNSGGFFGRRNTISKILAFVFVIILAVFVFYSILPGASVYATPSLVNQYILKGPYPFLAVVAPLIYLFFI